MTGNAICIGNAILGSQYLVPVTYANLYVQTLRYQGVFEAGPCLVSILNSLNIEA